MKVLLKISKCVDWLNERLGRLVAWLTFAMVLVAAYNALARYLPKSIAYLAEQTQLGFLNWLGDLVGQRNFTSNALLETQWYLFSAVFLLTGAYTLKHNAHVRVDVLYDRLSERARRWINLAGTFLFLIPFSLLLFLTSLPPLRASWAIKELSPDPGGLPRYPIKTLIPVAAALLLLQGISEAIKIIDAMRAARTSGDPEKETGT
jgi:TRAP-type mannitol/chloroaromatic compound transport system permease small subunit